MKTAVLVMTLFAAAPAAAENCAQYAEPLAYNACLARSGPPARALNLRPAPEAADARSPARVSRSAARRVQDGASVGRRRGRAEMVFSVGR